MKRFLSAVAIWLLLCRPAPAAEVVTFFKPASGGTPIALDNSSHAKDSLAATSWNPNAANLLVAADADALYVAIITEDSPGTPHAPTSVSSSLDGALTQYAPAGVQHTGAYNRIDWYYSLNPSAGTHSFTITWASNMEDKVIIAYSLKGSGAPNGATVVNNGSGTTVSASVDPSADNSWVLSAYCSGAETGVVSGYGAGQVNTITENNYTSVAATSTELIVTGADTQSFTTTTSQTRLLMSCLHVSRLQQ